MGDCGEFQFFGESLRKSGIGGSGIKEQPQTTMLRSKDIDCQFALHGGFHRNAHLTTAHTRRGPGFGWPQGYRSVREIKYNEVLAEELSADRIWNGRPRASIWSWRLHHRYVVERALTDRYRRHAEARPNRIPAECICRNVRFRQSDSARMLDNCFAEHQRGILNPSRIYPRAYLVTLHGNCRDRVLPDEGQWQANRQLLTFGGESRRGRGLQKSHEDNDNEPPLRSASGELSHCRASKAAAQRLRNEESSASGRRPPEQANGACPFGYGLYRD